MVVYRGKYTIDPSVAMGWCRELGPVSAVCVIDSAEPIRSSRKQAVERTAVLSTFLCSRQWDGCVHTSAADSLLVLTDW